MADEKDITENADAEAPEAAVQETPAPEVEAEAAETPAAEAPAPRARAARRAKADEAADDAPAPRARARRAARASARRAAEEKKATSRKRDAEPELVVRAQAKYVRSSARKARLVCDHIRGKSVEEARAILQFTPRAVARDWSKVLESAVANAEHNHELDGEDLFIKAAHADEGPTLKRFRPRAMGRATPIRKRTSHLTILLTPKG